MTTSSPEPANITLTNLSFDKSEPEVGEDILVTLELVNQGGLSKNHTVELLVNEEQVNSKVVKIDSNENISVDFSISFDESGTYTITAGGLSKTIEVSEAADILITNVEELQDMENYLSVHYALDDDIDASETEQWNDGKGFYPVGEFNGTFNGRGYEIDGLYINRTDVGETAGNQSGRGVGLFGHIGSDAVVKNVTLTGVDVTGGTRVGALAGDHDGIIRNAHSTGHVSVVSTQEAEYSWQGSAGGLVGSSGGEVTESHSSATVSGGRMIGGLVGAGGNITKSYSTGDVSGEESVGGLIGSGSDIRKSYATGSVTGGNNVGGLAGYLGETIRNCYAIADVTGDAHVGGLVGRARGDIYTSYSASSVTGDDNVGGLIGSRRTGYDAGENSFWDVDVSGQTESGGENEQGKPTFLMKSIDTYSDNSWDIVPEEDSGGAVWVIDTEEDYPRLGWE
jgi:hypothetical protein